MHILVTNDDGIHAPGIFELQSELRTIPGVKVTVMAPAMNQSLAGHRKTMSKPLRIDDVMLPDGTHAFACDGSPADAIALAVMGYIDDKVDLVVSGINQGANMGQDITYSGTVTAAMEAAIFGIPAFAVSLDSYDQQRFSHGARFAAQLAPVVYEHGLPEFSLLNVNIPLDEPRGVKITRQGRRHYYDELITRLDPAGRPYYWIGNKKPPGGDTEMVGTDVWAVANGYISITPIKLDMTHGTMLPDLNAWQIPTLLPDEAEQPS